jgi:hypothetical protein
VIGPAALRIALLEEHLQVLGIDCQRFIIPVANELAMADVTGPGFNAVGERHVVDSRKRRVIASRREIVLHMLICKSSGRDLSAFARLLSSHSMFVIWLCCVLRNKLQCRSNRFAARGDNNIVKQPSALIAFRMSLEAKSIETEFLDRLHGVRRKACYLLG